MRRTVLLLALAALPACGATDAVRTATPSPVRAVEVGPASGVEPQPEDPDQPAPSPSPSPDPVQPTAGPASPPPPSTPPTAEPRPDPLHDCFEVPQPSSSSGVEAELLLPPEVRPDTVGVLRVTNRGTEPVQVSGDTDELAWAVRAGRTISSGASNALGHAPVTLAPGEVREVRVHLATATCAADGTHQEEQPLPAGTYDVLAWTYAASQAVVTPPVRIAYRP